MSTTIKVDIDVGQVLALTQGFSANASQAAWRRTLRKTGRWVKAQTAKAVSHETRIPQKLLRQRLYFFLRSRDSGKVWLGLNAIEAHRLGKPRQTRSGISVGRHRFDRAWQMRRRAPDGPVYRRTTAARRPYEVVKVDWAGPGEAAFRQAAERAEERLLTVLRQEVNYEIHKALAKAR
ncbi:TPA: hypothetical protein RCG82_000621 [Enterobacter roggenkampii]|nr:hypothetical protein [Enterobacter roggenkampii]